jgi:transcriptional regulator GlxA family with amidase domain
MTNETIEHEFLFLREAYLSFLSRTGSGSLCQYSLIKVIEMMKDGKLKYTDTPEPLKNMSTDFVQAIQVLVYTHIEKGISIDEIASSCVYSRSRLLEKFKKYIGISLGRYIKESRMSYAGALLTSNISVTEIAQRMNFSSPYSFSRSFKKITGSSPREFKKLFHINSQ